MEVALRRCRETGTQGEKTRPARTLAVHAPVMLVQHALRPMLARFLRRSLPQLKVLSYAEVPDTRHVRVVNVIGA